VAHTYFFSSSGGRTAAVQEGFPGAAPMPYLRSVRDPWDRLSPHHDWSVRLTDRQARERLDDVAPGRFRSMRVVSRGAAGRVLAVRVRGTRGSATVAGTTIQAELGLRSTWFAVRR
jgi:stage II sporulation protein D